MNDEDELLIIDKRCSVTMFDMHVQVSRLSNKFLPFCDECMKKPELIKAWNEL